MRLCIMHALLNESIYVAVVIMGTDLYIVNCALNVMSYSILRMCTSTNKLCLFSCDGNESLYPLLPYLMKKIISILKNMRFSGKGRQSLHI